MGKIELQSVYMLNLTCLVKTMEVSYWICSVGSTKFVKKNIKILTLFWSLKGIWDRHEVRVRFNRNSRTSMF